jgi:hypothetical protein
MTQISSPPRKKPRSSAFSIVCMKIPSRPLRERPRYLCCVATRIAFVTVLSSKKSNWREKAALQALTGMTFCASPIFPAMLAAEPWIVWSPKAWSNRWTATSGAFPPIMPGRGCAIEARNRTCAIVRNIQDRPHKFRQFLHWTARARISKYGDGGGPWRFPCTITKSAFCAPTAAHTP